MLLPPVGYTPACADVRFYIKIRTEEPLTTLISQLFLPINCTPDTSYSIFAAMFWGGPQTSQIVDVSAWSSQH